MIFIGMTWGEKDWPFNIAFKLFDFWRSNKDIPLILIVIRFFDERLQISDFFEELCFKFRIVFD